MILDPLATLASAAIFTAPSASFASDIKTKPDEIKHVSILIKLLEQMTMKQSVALEGLQWNEMLDFAAYRILDFNEGLAFIGLMSG